MRQLLPLMLLASCAASGQTADNWRPVAPVGERFQVQMPAPEQKVQRDLLFEERLKLVLTSFETYQQSTQFMLLPVGRSDRPGEPEVLKTFDSFVAGFKYAVMQSGSGAGNEITDERAFEFEGRPAREFKVRLGPQTGVARLYETDKLFYIALVLADKPEQALFDRFFNSLTFKIAAPKSKREQPERNKSADATGNVPAGPWPVHRPTAPLKVGILEGRVLSKPQPMYPPLAKASHASGSVVVQIMVDEQGKVIAAEVVTGHPLLRPAAVEAAYGARFTPTVVEGQPVKVTGFITYNFVLM